MSYVRFAWEGSDVYVYDSCSGGIECCGCRFGSSFNCATPEEMIVHMAAHRRAGHFVPEYAITGLWHAIEGATKPREPQSKYLEESSLIMEAIQVKIMADRAKEAKKRRKK